jgi:aconitate hydratase
MTNSSFSVQTFTANNRTYGFYSVRQAAKEFKKDDSRLPYCIRILLESAIRHCDGLSITRDDVARLARWTPSADERFPLAFYPARVVLQDFTGVPVMVDLAAMRTEIERRGGDAARINPAIPVDLVVDHSIQMDFTGSPDALEKNVKVEFERNRERYRFLRWAQQAFTNLRIVPPSRGIIHQVNLERLSPVVQVSDDGLPVVYPDSVFGTDSHTTMINGLGVLGWGVGGIEAIAAMLDQPVELVTPDVTGIRLTGKLREGVMPTDLVLHMTQLLRKTGVVNQFLEYFGSGLDNLSLADRAMIANMTPENGATVSYFPVDNLTVEYLRLTGRSDEQVNLIKAYFEAQGLFREAGKPDPEYSSILEVDLGSVEPSVAGPKRPQDRIGLSKVKAEFNASLVKPKAERGYQLPEEKLANFTPVKLADGSTAVLRHGSVVLASITSCTNTSNPTVMLAAGLLARKAVEAGLSVPGFVKTSLAPGSRVVADYLQSSGLQPFLDKLGFQVAGFGCATCIGNSGPLASEVVDAIKQGELVAAAVLSGNRNFEGRVSPHTLANFLASPPMVVAYALAGRVDVDFDSEPIGTGLAGKAVYLKDIWPTREEIDTAAAESVTAELFNKAYADIFTGDEAWKSMDSRASLSYEWDSASSYIQEPPYFSLPGNTEEFPTALKNACVLAVFGDSVTTDHISPAGNIAEDSPAGLFLKNAGIAPADFNSYGSRRGNDRVMARGTFANVRLRNLMAGGKEGGYTIFQPDGDVTTIYDASIRYAEKKIPLVVLAGKEYGTGSSRDWAAKGPMLLGVKAVIAESFERIHRSNLAGMGILPLQFQVGENAASLGLEGTETIDVSFNAPALKPGCLVTVNAHRKNGTEFSFTATCRLDTPLEVQYYNQGGLLSAVLKTVNTL